MEQIIRIGFRSPTESFERDVTLDELLEILAAYVSDFEEASYAAELIGSFCTSGRYDGTDWSIWFVKRDVQPTLH